MPEIIDPRLWMNEEIDRLRGERDRLREENRELRRSLVFARDEINAGIEKADEIGGHPSGPEARRH